MSPSIRALLAILSIFCLVEHPAYAQQELKTIPDPDPELERRAFQVADGFEVNLFAADPLLAKPIQMNFDPAGRLWVASSAVYPQIVPGQNANDRILILEDRTGAGRADKMTVFADGLLIPTGIEPGDGGVYVANSTDLVHFSDTKGTGKADKQRTILSGFGTEDTHHILHTLRWGPDGMLYFNQSIYIHSHIETPYGVRHLNGGGIWQFRPETMQLEVFAHGFCNPWGHHFDRWGQSFETDGAYGEGINYVVPGASYVFTPGASRILAGMNPGSPKHCGLEILSGRHLPESWRGNLLTNDFRGHRVCRFVLSEDGCNYVSQEKPELIKTNHAAFRPIDVKMGPDGAIYIADWYNPIIQHGEVDFRDPRRDHTHGRIWRVTAKNRPLVARPKLVGVATEELLEALKAPEDWTRQQAKRVLKERGQSVLPALVAWVQRLDRADPGYEHHLLEALWTCQALDIVPESNPLLETLACAHDHHARAAAIRTLEYWGSRLATTPLMLARATTDEHPQVRLEAVRALARQGNATSAEQALKVLDRPMDKCLDYALWLTLRELAPHWLPLAVEGKFAQSDDIGHLLFALQSLGTPEAVKPLIGLLGAGKVPEEKRQQVFTLLATLGGPNELGMVFDRVLAKEVQAEERAGLLSALEQAARQRQALPAGDLTRLEQLIGSGDDRLRAHVFRLAGLWHREALRAKLEHCLRQPQTPDILQRAALDGLVSLGGPASRRVLAVLASPDHPLSLRMQALIALTSVDLEAAGRLVHPVLLAANGQDATDLFAAFLQRKNGNSVLLSALRNQKVPADLAKLGLRAIRATGHDTPQLTLLLTTAANLASGQRGLNTDQMRLMVADVLQHGDARRGETIYRRKDLTCMKCHAIGGAGGLVGPDLASIGASAPIDYLIESILQPNKAVKENYHSLVVATKQGRLITGIKVRETETDLILRDAEDREVAVPLKSIEEKSIGGSLMPEGLVDPLTHGELVDLVRFLSELGKVGLYSIGKAPVVRRWQVLEPNKPARDLLARTRVGSAALPHPGLSWIPTYSKVSGDLPVPDLPNFVSHKPDTTEVDRVAVVRCQFEASGMGQVQLTVNQENGLGLWLDGSPIDAAKRQVVNLTSGKHTLTIAVNLAQRQTDLRCEIDDAAGSAAHVRVVGGK
jgi:putative heme-binding domain-containing protein